MAKRRIRDAITGRFGSRADAEAHPETTVTETVSDMPAVLGKLRWRISKLTAALGEAGGDMDIASRAIKSLDYPGALNVLERASTDAYTVAHDHIPEETA